MQVDFRYLTSDYCYLEAILPDGFEEQLIEPQNMPANWRSNPPNPATQELGSSWIQGNKSLVFRVPSAVLPQEHNFLVNPNHPLFSKINFVNKKELQIDARVFDL